MKVYQVIAEVLRCEHVEVLFGLIGDGNMRFVTDFGSSDTARVVYARHENGAVAMADGFARASGALGVCSITLGPGLTSGATSIVTASHHRTPLIILAGALRTGERGNVQYMDQGRFVESLGARHIAVTSAAAVAEELRLAFAWARSGSTVVVTIPKDIQHADYDWDVDYVATLRPRLEPLPPPEAAVNAAAKILAQAQSPVIVAGRGAIEAGARDALIALAVTLGARLSTTLLAKGLFDGHPLDAGIAGLFATRSSQEALAMSDCVLAVGASLNRYTTEGGALFASATVVRVDNRPYTPLPEAREPDIYIQGDARLSAEALTGVLTGALQGHVARTPPPIAERGGVRRAPASPDFVDPNDLCIAINEELPSEQRFAIGAGHFWSFPIMHLKGRPADAYLFTHDFGSVGQALPTGIGAAFCRSRPVAVIEGDASVMMCLQELDTAVRYMLPLLVVIMNDEGLGADYHLLRVEGLRADQAIMRSPDLAAIARGLGAEAVEARSIEVARSALRSYAANPRPFLVDVRISRDVVSELFARLYFPDQLVD